MFKIVNDILVNYPDAMSEEEVRQYVEQEIEIWKNKNKKISHIEMILDDEEVIVLAGEKSPIKRVRRITGYLSEIGNFNSAKKAELAVREINVGSWQLKRAAIDELLDNRN